MDFIKISLDDNEILKPYLNKANFNICDYSLGTFLMWRDYYNIEYCIKDNVLYSRLYNKDGEVFYNIPLGIELYKGIEILKQELKQDHLSFCTIPENYVEEFRKYYPSLDIEEYLDFSDYLYNASDLREYKGKRYGGQRNMIHQFERENPNYCYIDINKNNVNEALEFLDKHYKVSDNASEFEKEEERKVIEVLNNLDKYELFGSMLKVDNEVVGFQLGEIINDTCFMHIEKANREFKGVYQILVKLFANKYTNEKIKYINREEDVGDIGLRTSKLSYHPCALLKKYTIKI